MNAVTAQVHVDCADIAVRFHCDHEDGQSSYRVECDHEQITVYLQGTPEQLGAFADAIVRAVSKHTIETHVYAVTERLRAGA